MASNVRESSLHAHPGTSAATGPIRLVVISNTRNPYVKCAKSCEIPPARPALGQTVPCRRPTTTTSGPDGNRQDHAKAEAKCQLAFEHENRTPNFLTSAAICTWSTCARPTFYQPAVLVEGPSPTLGFPTAIVLSIRLYSLVMDKNAETAQSVALTCGGGGSFKPEAGEGSGQAQHACESICFDPPTF